MKDRLSLPVRIAVCGLQYYLEYNRMPTLDSPPIAALLDEVVSGSNAGNAGGNTGGNAGNAGGNADAADNVGGNADSAGVNQQERQLLAELRERAAGVFVSYHRRSSDELRGCIGTILPTTENVLTEICCNTVSAGIKDPRFPPIKLDELPLLRCKVDVLGVPEPIKGTDELDVKRYGVIVSRGWRRGLLLPDLDGVDTVDYQLSIALSKAGIRPNEPYQMERFEVIRYE